MRALVWSLAAWGALSVYGGLVCPLLDGLGLGRTGVLVGPGLLLGALLRPVLLRAIVDGAPALDQAPRQLRVDLGLALLAGLTELGLAMLLYGFPAESGVKVTLGALTLGSFAAVDLALARERALLPGAPTPDHLDGVGSLGARFSIAAALMLGLATLDVVLVLGKGLLWLADLDPAQQALGRGQLMGEVAMVLGSVVTLTLVVVRGWALTLSARLNRHNMVLARVEEGRLDVAAPVSVRDELGLLAARTNQMIAGLAERERLRQVLGKVTSAEAARRLLDDSAGERRELVVLMSDLRGFTSLSEGRRPEEVVDLLNAWFGRAVPVVHAEGGVVDKFIGDGMLAVFGLDGAPDAAGRALRAALGLVAAARALSDEQRHAVRVGVGLHRGPAVAGTIGSPERLEFTVIGDTVNTAARIEAATRTLGVDIAWSGALADALGDLPAGVIDLGAHQLRGRAAATPLFGLRARPEERRTAPGAPESC